MSNVPGHAGEHGPRQRRLLLHRRHVDTSLGFVHLIEDVVHYGVATLLLGVSLVVLWHSTVQLVDHEQAFAERVTSVVNGILFVIIVLEILRTVVAHFEEADLQLKPFLIIGIISAVRHILTIGAQSSLGATEGSSRDNQIELGLNALVVVTLVIGLVLVRRSDEAEAPTEAEP